MEQKYCKDNELLIDKFDQVTGTSAGGIVAVLMAQRYSISEIESFFYRHLKEDVFDKNLYLPFTRKYYIPILGRIPYIGGFLRFFRNNFCLYVPKFDLIE